MEEVLIQIQQIIEHAEKNGLTNTQEFLDFLDKLNELSIRY